MAKRTFEIIRLLILNSLSSGSKTVNQLSNNSGLNWRTVDNHITYLLGKGLVKQVIFSDALEGRRKSGRPLLSWRHSISQDMKFFGL